jgi:hypothetical protein
MRRILLSALLAIFSFAVLAQKTVNDPNAEKRNTVSFHGIEVGTGIELLLTAGNTEEVVVSASTTTYRDRIVTEVENGILKIHYEYKIAGGPGRKENKQLKAYVSYKTLDRLDAHTGADVTIEGILKSGKLKMRVNTGATVRGKIDVAELDLEQDTGSVVTLTGEATSISVEGDTGSIFQGGELKTNNCRAVTSTGAGIYIYVSKDLKAKADTGGFVKYSGGAGISEMKTSTGGSVSKI